MLETISKMTPHLGMVLRWDILFSRLWAKPWHTNTQPYVLSLSLQWWSCDYVRERANESLCERDPTHKASGATHLSPSDVDADAFPEYQLHVCRVTQLNRCPDRQVDPLVSWCHATQLGTLVDRRVPGGLCLHLDNIKNNGKWTAKRFPPFAS